MVIQATATRLRATNPINRGQVGHDMQPLVQTLATTTGQILDCVKWLRTWRQEKLKIIRS